jgi:hypothetical protein
MKSYISKSTAKLSCPMELGYVELGYMKVGYMKVGYSRISKIKKI